MAGLITVNNGNPGGKVKKIECTWVGDAADGTVPPKAVRAFSGVVIRVVTDPGTPAPTTLYDITLTDSNGIDVLGGAGANRSATVTEQCFPTVATVPWECPVAGALTLTITGNSVVSAQGSVVIYIREE
jgi:hypothetical protein